MSKNLSGAFIKASLLSNGVNLSKSLLDNYGLNYLEKRRAYGNPDPLDIEQYRIPQEMYILPENLICSVNVKYDSPWSMIFENGKYFVVNDYEQVEVTFPLRPFYYDDILSTGQKISQVMTLYGGSSMGIFVFGNCYFAMRGKECKYCSIKPNRAKNKDFESLITANQLEEVLEYVLNSKENQIRQVMINGGNLPDSDKNFEFYLEIAKKADEVLKKHSSSIDLHMIIYPPDNLDLLNGLKKLNISIAMNTEAFDRKVFSEFCPGKYALTKREHHYEALFKCREIIGKGNVFSIFVGGLENIDSLREGMRYLAENEIVPVINVLHTDPETDMEHYPNPSTEAIMAMGKELQDIYKKYKIPLKPFYDNCGRNAIDYEAFHGLF